MRRDLGIGRDERGSAMLMSIIMVIVVALIVGAIAIMSLRTNDRSADAARRVSNDATVQAAVTRILYGFQNDLAGEHDYFTLDNQDLLALATGVGSTSTVLEPNQLPGLPPQLAQVDDVYEHVVSGGQHRLQRVPDAAARQPASIMEERVQVSPAACSASGLPAQTCAGTVFAFWQVYRTDVPDITGSTPPHVVLYVRSWLGSRQARAYSKASIARVELRPGRFADFQQISDGNVRIAEGASINGPVHSNGMADASFSTVHAAPAGAVGGSDRWIYAEPGAACTGEASLSITRGVIAAGGCPRVGATGQTISFLRVADSVEAMRRAAIAGRPGVRVLTSSGRRGAERQRSPYDTAWRVTINGRTAAIDYPDGSSYGSIPLGRVNAFVFDEDVRVRGTAADDVRITLAAERFGGGAASIYINGDLRKGDPQTSAIGLIAQGDVVLWMDGGPGGSACPVHTVEAGIVAASGGMTIPTNYATPEYQPYAPKCSGTLRVHGSVAGHRPPLMVWGWTGGAGREAGYTGERRYTWDKQLKRNPPPYFPLTGSWQPYQVREANTDCLYNASLRVDPGCR